MKNTLRTEIPPKISQTKPFLKGLVSDELDFILIHPINIQ
jgi:hypothetical protein